MGRIRAKEGFLSSVIQQGWRRKQDEVAMELVVRREMLRVHLKLNVSRDFF